MAAVSYPTDKPRGFGLALAATAVLVIIAVVYWPIHQAQFIWDDKVLFHDTNWLSRGSQWIGIVIHGIPDWNYFRPLGLLLMATEARSFGPTPGPMHVLSLALLLANTAIVGALAWRLRPQGHDGIAAKFVGIAMLVYGLHPALVEPVAWIASQFDLLVTLFMMLGLLLNLVLRRAVLRVPVVSICFFLAACSKESALAFPVLLVLLDWVQPGGSTDTSTPRDRAYAIMRRQWPVYLAVLVAGLAYMAFRIWSKSGHALTSFDAPFLTWERFQTVCYTYMIMWKMIVWPFAGLAPIHIFADGYFVATNVASLATDVAAVLLGATGVLLAWRRSKIGILIVGVSAILFPVLHIIPLSFDNSLYHDRYAAPCIAFVCALLPGVIAALPSFETPWRAVSKLAMVLMTGWLLFAALTVRTTIPLWYNDARMWEWAWRISPDSTFVSDALMSTCLQSGDLRRATSLANFLMVKGRSCATCMMNVAALALQEHDTRRATEALALADKAFTHTQTNHTTVLTYVLLNGNLRQEENDDAGAEGAYRDVISIDPLRPDGYMSLALLLAHEGKADEARMEFDKVVSMLAPDSIGEWRAEFAAASESGAAALPAR